MANTRAIRASKRQRTDQRTYRDRLVLPDDFEVIHSRQSSLTSTRRIPVETQRSPQRGRTAWLFGDSWAPEDSTEVGLEPDWSWCDAAFEGPVTEVLPATNKSKGKAKKPRRPHLIWKERYRALYLDEMLRWEGRADVRTQKDCPDCVARKVSPPAEPEFRCHDCFLPDLVCSGCCVRRHHRHPLHVVERWTGSYFIRTTLKSMGLCIQLGHVSMRCINSEPCPLNFRILHTNGIHDVSIKYCGCEGAPTRHQQLLRRGLYPATQLNVKTCASFQLLELLHLLALTSKASTYDFYRALEKAMDNTGLHSSKSTSRYRGLLRMSLQWRHLKLLKRGGRAHDPSGVAGTQPGELAIACPSCPMPGINLPTDWDDPSRDAEGFLYTKIFCMDANFRLKNQLVSSFSSDPGLGIGMAYMVPRLPYDAYVLSRTQDDDISTCVGLAALAKANTRFSKGLRFTGVGAVSCGRSEMIAPKSVGNLQKGERYANMDYMFGSALQDASPLLNVVISYDIACQWFVNLSKRIEEHWPEDLKPNPQLTLRPLIPKLHEPGHKKAGHQEYLFNYARGVGLTDGECPERIWAGHNALGNATKTQGPGSRHDVLDDHFSFWNWLKYSGMGGTLMRKYKAAIRERNIQVEGHRGFTATLSEEMVGRWEELCMEWERDPFPKKAENPYVTDGICLTESQVQKELAEEERSLLANGGVALHETSASAFLVLGLELEESQRQLRDLVRDKAGRRASGLQTSITERRSVLQAAIRNWEPLRALYMPGLLQLLTDMEANARPNAEVSSTSTHPEDIPLWLPSGVPPSRLHTICAPSLPIMEQKLRTAQCHDALDGLRHILRVKTRMVLFKNKNVRGQRDGLRSRAVIDRVHARARGCAERYRFSREARLKLSGPGDWEAVLRVLHDSDIRSYADPNRLRRGPGRRGTAEEGEEQVRESAEAPGAGGGCISLLPEQRSTRDGTGETRRTLSWIWTMESRGVAEDAERNDDILRAEWAMSRARAARATEEVQLLREEMRRVLAFLDWKARWWTHKLGARETRDKELAEGLAAYAYEQANLQRSLATSFGLEWRGSLEQSNEDEGVPPDDNDDPDMPDDDDDGGDDDDAPDSGNSPDNVHLHEENSEDEGGEGEEARE